jgi:hypothetical protein
MATQPLIHTQISAALFTLRQAREHGCPLDVELATARLDMLLDRMARNPIPA